MKKQCSNCKFWRIKSDERGICDHPTWNVVNSLSEETALRLLIDLQYSERQKINLVREFMGIRTNDVFCCNQYEKR